MLWFGRVPPLRILAALAVVLAAAPVGCSGYPSILTRASPEASRIADLFWMLLAIAALVFVVVEGLLIFAVIRFRSRPGDGEPEPVHGNWRLEIAWTLAPASILAIIFVFMFSTMESLSHPDAGARRIKIVGHQWWWEIHYPDLGVTTATDLHVPYGQPVALELTSADVIHGIWAPELMGKTDVIPGQTTWAKFRAIKPGTYRGQCTEFCGTQHANMGFLVIAEQRDQFEEWIARMRMPAAVPGDTPTERGARLFSTRPCGGCHTVQGTQAQGKTAPDLTHFGSRRTIASATLDNTPENLAAWLADPQQVKPGNMMPSPGLSQEDIQYLVHYLGSLK